MTLSYLAAVLCAPIILSNTFSVVLHANTVSFSNIDYLIISAHFERAKAPQFIGHRIKMPLCKCRFFHQSLIKTNSVHILSINQRHFQRSPFCIMVYLCTHTHTRISNKFSISDMIFFGQIIIYPKWVDDGNAVGKFIIRSICNLIL